MHYLVLYPTCHPHLGLPWFLAGGKMGGRRSLIFAWRILKVLVGSHVLVVGRWAQSLWEAVWSQTSSGGAEEGLRPLRHNPSCRSPAHRFAHVGCTIPLVHPASSAGWCKGKWINGLALFHSSGVTWEARREQICSHDRTCPLSTLHEVVTAHF